MRERVGADGNGQLGEVRVARLDGGVVQGDGAVRGAVVRVIVNRRPEAWNAHADAAAGQARADKGSILVSGVFVQRRRRGDHLERRARRVEAVPRAVQQGVEV
jgi:hypothetical protein